MSADTYDVIVVGAGVEGSATAYELVKRKQNTLLLEQFPLPHSRGSSHGQSRITRYVYNTEYYMDMMPEAYAGIDTLEKETNQQLFRKVGCMAIAPIGDTALEFSIEQFKKRRWPYEYFTPEELKKRFPQFDYGPSVSAFLDPNGGILRADKILQGFRDVFVRNGGELREGEEMVNIYPGDVVTVLTTKGTYKAKSVVLATGPWAPKVFRLLGLNVPLKVKRILVLYWKERVPGTFSTTHTPTVVTRCDADEFFGVYGLPCEEYPGLFKFCLHDGPEIDPNSPGAADDSETLSTMIEHVRQNLPGLDPKPSVVESCIYTCTEDANFILDKHPAWKNIVLAAGFSGHGFKLSPVVGKLLADLALNRTPAYSLEPFRLNRFWKSHM